MSDKSIMSRGDVFKLIDALGAATLSGKPVPELNLAGNMVRSEDLADATEAFTRRVADRLNKVADAVSDDLVVQERVRAEIDKVVMTAAQSMRDAVSKLCDEG